MPEVMLEQTELATLSTLLGGLESTSSDRLLGEPSHVSLRSEGGPTLGRLLDLAGSVHLSNWLDRPRSFDYEPARADLSYLRREILARTSWLRRSAADRFQKPLEMYAPEEIHEALLDANVLKRPNAKVIERVGAKIAQNLADALITNVQRVRAELSVIRLDLSAPIRALSTAAADLDAFDQEITRATTRKTGLLFDNFADALKLRFGRLLREAVMSLPRGLSEEELATIVNEWCVDGGFVARFEWTIRQLILSLVESECIAFEGFIDTIAGMTEADPDRVVSEARANP